MCSTSSHETFTSDMLLNFVRSLTKHIKVKKLVVINMVMINGQ